MKLNEAQKYWATPTVNGNYNRKASQTSGDGLATQVRKWPTPQASDNRDRGNLSSGAVKRRQAIGKQISLSQSVSDICGQLNPTWVEWLMGYQPGWTDLNQLGNAIVPQIATYIGNRILEYERTNQ